MSEHLNDIAWLVDSSLYQKLRFVSNKKKPNILKRLFVTHDEVRLHTPVLGWLLDPNGDHGLAEKPLVNFLSGLGIRAVGAEAAHVWRERSFPRWGQVDLMIQLPGFCLIIENKLRAIDQFGQLWRYRQIMHSLSDSCSQSYLFYLTPEGRKPSESSAQGPNGFEVLEGHDYQCISYQSEVRTWLEGLLELTRADPDKKIIHHILAQYHEVVLEVVGMHSRNEALEQLEDSGLKSHVEQNPADVEMLSRLRESIFFLHAHLLEELVRSAHETLRKHPRLKPVPAPSRWKELGWTIYEGWARGGAPVGYLFYEVVDMRDTSMEGLHLVIGMGSSDRFWVGLARFDGALHLKVGSDCYHFKDIEGATGNDWWLSWVTVRDVDPALFNGDKGVGRLVSTDIGKEVVESVMAICNGYLRGLGL